MKQEVATRKRRVRCAAPIRRASVVEEYLQTKNNYEQKLKEAQVQSWRDFCTKQDREGMWEGIYRVIGRTRQQHEDLPLTNEGRTLSHIESAKLLADTFYPEDQIQDDSVEHRRVRIAADHINMQGHNENHDPLFTTAELQRAVESFNPKKAPGSDGMSASICQRAINHEPGIFLSLANKCLQLGYFPEIWKEATVVILRKPHKPDYTAPKSYRPIGLLPVMGKILEKMLICRIKWHLVPRLSSLQYGFMPQRSTEDSLYDLIEIIKSKVKQRKIVVLVSLDIEGAFDGAWWPAIRTRLAEENCPINIRRIMDSYLNSRKVRVRYAGEEVTKETTKGCVQGSIGGPILWNLLLDPLLKGLQARGDYCQAFADDVVLVFDGNTALEIQQRANAALAYAQQWGVRNKLKFAPHKTNALLITRKLKYDAPLLNMGGVPIEMSKEMRVLGLWVDDKLTFNTHVSKVCVKALNIYKQISRAAKISWGLHPEIIRTMYTSVVEPVVMYAAAAWSSATKKWCIQKQLNAVQRGFAQKLCRAYRTVSLNSSLVLAGILPLDLRIQEAAALYEAKRGSSLAALGDREIERRVAFSVIPHPSLCVDLQFTCLVNDEQVGKTDHHQLIKIFTDGSKIDGKVGAALSLWSNAVETRHRKFKLSSYCTVYQAELLAIHGATDEILKSRDHKFGIYSDSKSALQTVVNVGSLNPLAVDIRKNLNQIDIQGKQVQLFWIKAHAGLEGNERADELAKQAALQLRCRPHYDKCPISFVKRQIRIETLGEWNRRYTTGETGKVTKVFFPVPTEAFRTVRKIKPTGILTQIMTGHGGFSQYLHRFKLKDSPSCICDPDREETPLHIITECPVYGKERHETEQKIGQVIAVNTMSKIINDKNISTKFIEFSEEICKKVVKRNK